jgi:TolB protein
LGGYSRIKQRSADKDNDMKNQAASFIVCVLVGVLFLTACGSATPVPLPPVVISSPTPKNPFGTLVASTPLPSNTPTLAPEPPSNIIGRIAFLGSSSGSMDIFTVNADGTALTKLTNDQPVASATDPTYRWSPTGEKIAFTSLSGSNASISLINSDGSKTTKVVDNGGLPTWSPDGKRIAFACLNGVFQEICVMNSDGTGVNRLTNHSARDLLPLWSPDGKQIAFASTRGNDVSNWQIYVINADGTGQKRLATIPRAYPRAWSPDSKQIAFSSDAGGDNSGVYVVKADGSQLVKLSGANESGDWPTWSPDSTRLAFAQFSNDRADIHVVNADGSALTNLTKNLDRTANIMPAWSPDGAQIAFVSALDGTGAKSEIYVINADGTEQKQLTQNSSEDTYFHPAWQPSSVSPPVSTEVTVTPAANVASQKWEGTGDHSFRITVETDVANSVYSSLYFECKDQAGNLYAPIYGQPPQPIENGEFKYSNPRDDKVIGKFIAPDRIEGTFRLWAGKCEGSWSASPKE